MGSHEELVRALALEEASTIHAPDPLLLDLRKLLARGGRVVFEQLTDAPIDAALLLAPPAVGPMPRMQEELARISSRLKLGGCVIFFEPSSGARARDLDVRVKLAARSVGLVPGKGVTISGGTLVRCVRPPALPLLESLAKRLPPSPRVAVLGHPLTPLASVQSTFGPSVESGYEQETGKLHLVVYALEDAHTTDLPRIRQRLAPGATLLVLYPSAPTGGSTWYKPAAVVASVEPSGFEVSGKPRPFPLTPELRCLAFVLRGGARVRAEAAPRLASPRPAASKTRASKARAAATAGPQGEVVRALGKPVALAQRARERKRTPGSTCGPVTWALRGEPWPTDSRGKAMLHHGTVRVDELPFVPEGLRDVAMLSVFAPAGGKGADVVVRVRNGLEGLVRSTSPTGALGLRAAPEAAPRSVKWKAATDWPTPERAREALPASTRVPTRVMQEVLGAIGAPHHRGMKVGGWPRTKPKAGYLMALPADSIQSLDGYIEDRTFLVHRRGARWVVELETVRSEP